MISLLTATAVDETVFTTIVNGATKALGLFSVYPINIFLGMTVMGVAIGIALKLKH